MRTARDERDVERVATLNDEVHGELVGNMTRRLFAHHPRTELADLIFVEDEASGEVVSTLCLIPWLWNCDGVEVPTGEMGIVSTREAYRRRGLVRAQVVLFKRRLAERGCLLSQIQGIPYFYRQFGYDYALPLERRVVLEMRQVADGLGDGFTFRQASEEDLPILMELYDAAMEELAIHAVRGEATWLYLSAHTADSEMERETWLVDAPDGQVAGFFTLPHHHFGAELTVSEVSTLSLEAAMAALSHLKRLALEREMPGIRLNLPLACTLVQAALALGARDEGAYAWQIHVPDMVALLRAMAPVLERRVERSSIAGLTSDVHLCRYASTICLRFVDGQLTAVEDVGFTDWAQEAVRFPPDQLMPVVLGYRTWHELKTFYPDVSVAGEMGHVLDILFPKTASFIYTTY